MANLQHALTFSLITYLKAEVPALQDVIWQYDGVSLTGRAKPFSSVEQMQSNTSMLAKERAYYETSYRYQIGLYASSASERALLEDVMRTALLAPEIPLLDTSQPFPPPTVGFFYCDVTATTPMPAESASDETGKHRLYFDVEITVQVKNGGNTFEQ